MTENFIDRRHTLPEEHEPVNINTDEDSKVYNEFLNTPPEYMLELFNSNTKKVFLIMCFLQYIVNVIFKI